MLKTVKDPAGDHRTAVKKEDLKWLTLDHTSVETQTWYFTMEGGALGLAQVIYSNVAYVVWFCPVVGVRVRVGGEGVRHRHRHRHRVGEGILFNKLVMGATL